MTYEYITQEPNKWSKWQIWPRKVRFRCCDCAMIHDVQAKVDKDRNILLRWKVNNKATAAARRTT